MIWSKSVSVIEQKQNKHHWTWDPNEIYNKYKTALVTNLYWSWWENPFQNQPIDIDIDNIFTIIDCFFKMIAQITHMTRNMKEMQNCSDEKSIWAVLEQILLKISFVLPWARPTSGSQNKSKWAETTTHPIAFLGPIRSWNTNRNLFSPTNGREISSSVYGRTRPTQLYLKFFSLGRTGAST